MFSGESKRENRGRGDGEAVRRRGGLVWSGRQGAHPTNTQHSPNACLIYYSREYGREYDGEGDRKYDRKCDQVEGDVGIKQLAEVTSTRPKYIDQKQSKSTLTTSL